MQSEPAMIAYDRPSHKLMGFLAKHFNLRDYVKQNNNYVVFDDYYLVAPTGGRKMNGQSTIYPSAPVRQSTQVLDS